MEEYFKSFGDEIFYFTYVLLGLCIVLAVIIPLVKSIDNPKSLIKVGVGIVALAIIYFICLYTASGDLSFTHKEFDLSATVLKNIGAMLRMTYVMLLVPFGGAIIIELLKLVLFR